MAFRRHKDLKKWTEGFNHGSPSPIFQTDFHTFYYSFLVGVIEGDMGNEDDLKNTTEMAKDFTESFRSSKYQMISILISAYLKEQGFELNDTENVKKIINALIDVETMSLSSQGFKRINQYAYRGFEIIQSDNKYAVNPAVTIAKILDLIG